jgi:hypothetical protein
MHIVYQADYHYPNVFECTARQLEKAKNIGWFWYPSGRDTRGMSHLNFVKALTEHGHKLDVIADISTRSK